MKLEVLLDQTPARLVFMDCDGVIFDTNALKCDAFRVALEGYPRDQVESLVDYHRQTGGVSRYLKFERFFREMHPVADPESAMKDALSRFAQHCEVGYARMRPRPEALAFAELFGPDRVYVVSGSDEAELRRVFERQEIDSRFVAIHGSPTTKKVHLRHLLEKHAVSSKEALFVGDGWGDWDCAKALDVPFVFLAEMSEWDDGPEIVAASRGPMAIAETWHDLLETTRKRA
jgi:phosphoglycolate phosphatase-like HAD superfamily hydrolase